MVQQTRQLSGQLEVEANDNKALRARLQAMEEESDMRFVLGCALVARL